MADKTQPASDFTNPPGPMSDWVPLELTAADRKHWAEARIAELAPLEHAAVEKVNGVLTAEQHAERIRASVQGRRFGLSGLSLYHHIMAALQLTDEQKTSLAEARRELRSIREAIAPQVITLLDEQQQRHLESEESGSA